MTTDISLLGLGPMGSALARVLIAAGQRITVWNRSAAKARAMGDLGAGVAETVAAAVAASPVTLVCLEAYQTTRALFQTPEVVRLLPGHVVVELTTGTPNEAREADARFTALGALYLDGAILCGVPSIGTPAGLLIYSGNSVAFEQARALLAALGAAPRFVGTEVGTASALDMAWLSRIIGDYIGIYHGAAICRAERVGIDLFAEMFQAEGSEQSYLAPLLNNDFGHATADVAVWNKAVKRIAAQARQAGISPAVPDLATAILTRTEAAGFGHQHMAAMVKVLERAEDTAAEG